MKNYRFGFQSHETGRPSPKNYSIAYGNYATLNSKQIEVYYEYVDFEDISTEDTIYADEKNNRAISNCFSCLL